jgi:hypothetical protein
MNPLDRLKKRQQASGAQTPAQVRAASRPAKDIPGSLAHYQAAVAVAIEAQKTFPAMSPERTNAKRQALADVLPWVKQYMDRGERYPNSVAVQALIWLFDVGNIEEALRLGLYLIKTRSQHMPGGFKRRELEPFVCQAVYDWAALQLKEKASAEPYLGGLIAALEGGEWDVHPLIAGMLYAMAAKHARRLGEWAECLDWCRKAQAANPQGAGVQTMLDQAVDALEVEQMKERKAAAREAAANQPPQAGRAGEDGGGKSLPAE